MLKSYSAFTPEKQYKISQVVLNNYLILSRDDFIEPVLEGDYQLEYKGIRTNYGIASFLLSADLKWSGHELRVFFDLGACRRILDSQVSLKSFLAIPQELKSAIVAVGIESLLGHISSVHIDDVAIENVTAVNSKAFKKDVWLFALSSRDENIGHVAIHYKDNKLENFDAKVSSALSATTITSLKSESQFPVEVCLNIGALKVSPHELEDISPGDLFILDRALERDEFCLWICQTYKAIGRLHERHITIEKIWGKPMNEEQLNIEAQVEVVDIEDLDIQLRFDVGGISLPLSEVAAIRQGYVFSLPDEYQKRVLIKNNEKVIAVGELVSVEGKLGIQVLEAHYGISR